ncbi:MAG: apolipoprotein N-acyltransferase [bacterium]|nr:apolipoprotein N-acyltransferase [bacterium]
MTADEVSLPHIILSPTNSFLRTHRYFIVSALLFVCSFHIFSDNLQPIISLGAFFSFNRALKKELFSLTSLLLIALPATFLIHPWLPETLHNFGGYNLAICGLMTLAYCLRTVFLIGIIISIHRILKKTILGPLHLATGISVFLAEIIIPNIFPWSFASTSIGWSSSASWASIIGVNGLVIPLFLLMSLLDQTLELWQHKLRRASLLPASILLSLTVVYHAGGHLMNKNTLSQENGHISISAVQGNLDHQKKGNTQFNSINLSLYRDLSRGSPKSDLLVWPETTFPYPIPETITSVEQTEHDPLPEATTNLLFGAIISTDNGMFYNAALLRSPMGNISGRYYKRGLMPFGEFIPLADYLPWLEQYFKKSMPLLTGQTPGIITLQTKDSLAKMAILICYEDLLPEISNKRIVEEEANLLLAISNDGWFSDSSALQQHNLLARWRAIETRKSLVRVTNTGISSVSDPTGRQIKWIPENSVNIMRSNVYLYPGLTFFATWGNLPTLLTSCLLAIVALAHSWWSSRRDS